MITENITLQPRAAHTSSVLNNKIYFFGGWNGESAMNITNIYSIDKDKWSNLITSGEVPSERNNHSSCVYKNRIYIHGGHNGQDWLGDFYYLDITNNNWKEIKKNESFPIERACHSLSHINNKLYLFGGYNGKKSFNDVEIFDIKTSKWYVEYEFNGEAPSPRNAHSSCVVGTKIYIYGGHSCNIHLNDLYFYETLNKTWFKPKLKGDISQCIRGHTSTYYYNKIYIFGGYDGKERLSQLMSIDIESYQLTKYNLKENIVPRQRHTANIINTNQILFFGGFEGSSWLNISEVLDIHELEISILKRKSTESLNNDVKKMLSDKYFSDIVFYSAINNQSNVNTIETNNKTTTIENSQTSTQYSQIKKNQIAIHSSTSRVIKENNSILMYGHKVFLSHLSDYFKNLFLLNLKEEPLKLVIESVDEEAFISFMNFIYSNELPIKKSTLLISLYELSDKYCFSNLKTYLEYQLYMILNEENILDILILSYKVNSDFLVNSCIDYIALRVNNRLDYKTILQKLILYPPLMMKLSKLIIRQ